MVCSTSLTHGKESIQSLILHRYSKVIVTLAKKSEEDETKQQQRDVQLEDTQDQHVKSSSANLLSSQYFDDIFALLRGFGKDEKSSMIAHSAWRLIKKLPPSNALNVKMSRESSDKIDWEKILPRSISSYTGQYCYSYVVFSYVGEKFNHIPKILRISPYHSLVLLHSQELRFELLTYIVECYENSDTNARTQVRAFVRNSIVLEPNSRRQVVSNEFRGRCT